jgi:hypothetical protein
MNSPYECKGNGKFPSRDGCEQAAINLQGGYCEPCNILHYCGNGSCGPYACGGEECWCLKVSTASPSCDCSTFGGTDNPDSCTYGASVPYYPYCDTKKLTCYACITPTTLSPTPSCICVSICEESCFNEPDDCKSYIDYLRTYYSLQCVCGPRQCNCDIYTTSCTCALDCHDVTTPTPTHPTPTPTRTKRTPTPTPTPTPSDCKDPEHCCKTQQDADNNAAGKCASDDCCIKNSGSEQVPGPSSNSVPPCPQFYTCYYVSLTNTNETVQAIGSNLAGNCVDEGTSCTSASAPLCTSYGVPIYPEMHGNAPNDNTYRC